MKSKSFHVCFLMTVIFSCILNLSYGQIKGITDGLVTWDDVNQTTRKVSKQVMGIESKTLGLINDFDFSALKSTVGPDKK